MIQDPVATKWILLPTKLKTRCVAYNGADMLNRTFSAGLWLVLVVALSPAPLRAQVINGYAQVTAISGNVLTIGSSNETAATFAAGGHLVLMQMQDDVIGSTANNSTFGNLGTIKMAGNYVIRMIASVTRSGSILTSITLQAAPGMTFNIGANTSVQVITHAVPGGSGNYTTTGNIAAHPWNGSYGGVVSLQVNGTLNLAHNITADGAGFRGGARDAYSYTSPCNTTDFVWNSVGTGTEYFATKGEGIYKLSGTTLADGRGKILNGGGGANQINAGGGGGGNYTAGGNAGLGWSCTADAGGLGGLGMSSYITGSRVFLGGGGGGGEGNDNVSTDGANGGGIILIQAQSLQTTGTGSVSITANGYSAGTSGNDGAGAGGAGGSIVLNIPSYSIASTKPLTIEANGGAGGTVNNSTHGGGAGGGQGVVIFSITRPTTNITTRTQNGIGGCNETPCVTRAGSGAGSNDAGIISNSHTPLPIELLGFNAALDGSQVDLEWSTASERDNALFTIERSADAATWHAVGTLPGAGTSYSVQHYSDVDLDPLPGLSYYRLRQTDLDGLESWSNSVSVFMSTATNMFRIFPNPASTQVTLVYDNGLNGGRIEVTDELGRRLLQLEAETGRALVDLSDLPNGAYLLSLHTANGTQHERLIIRH